MPSSYFFTGAGFSLASATALSQTLVQVDYTSAPQASSPSGVHDALNPANYAFAGPGGAVLTAVTPVGANPLAFQLHFGAPLLPGTWTVLVTNVRDPYGSPLGAPTSEVFVIVPNSAQPSLTSGDAVTNPEPIIRKHLSPALAGPNWDGLIAALEQGDIYNRENATAAFNQLFISTASGPYLTQRGADNGITRPVNVGISDPLFSQLIIDVSTNKVVQEAIREILEVFYGQNSLRAFALSGTTEPYNLSGNVFDLEWTVDETTAFKYTFQNSDFAASGAGRAIEVAAALTRVMHTAGSEAFAIATPSLTVAGVNQVAIYSPSLGLRSFVRVTGGLAQNVFQFPEPLNPYVGTITVVNNYQWVYTKPTQSTTLISLTVNTLGGPALIDFSSLRPGDYVVITVPAQTGFTGTFQILNVTYSYSGTFLTQTLTIPQIPTTGTFVQASNSGYSFYRPEKQSIYEPNGRTVIVSQSVPGRVDINIPATSSAVNRNLANGAYIHANAGNTVERYQRTAGGLVTLTFSAPHGLLVGQQIYIDRVQPAFSVPFIDFAIPGGTPEDPRQNPASLVTCFANLGPTPLGSFGRGGIAGTLLSNGQFLVTGGNYSLVTPLCTRLQEDASVVISDGTEANGAIAHVTQWVDTASMATARAYHSICPYGIQALVAGGESGGFSFVSAELYDPGANTWTTTGAMSTARTRFQLVDLQNGMALAIGGNPSVGVYTATTEVFNGSSWASSGSMNYPRSEFQAVRLSNGVVMACGGYTTGGAVSFTSETWNGGVWTKSGLMSHGRAAFAAIVLPNFVLIAGGLAVATNDPNNPADIDVTSSCEIWNPQSGRWSPMTSMNIPRHNFFLAYVPALNRVYAIGGINDGPPLADPGTVEYLDLNTGRWYLSPAVVNFSQAVAIGGTLNSGAIYVDLGISGPQGPGLVVPASEGVSGGGLNDLFVTIVAVPTSTTLQFLTADGAGDEVYSSNFSNFDPTGFALSLSRAAGIVTAMMTLPTGYVVDLQPGDLVYVNAIASSGLISGIKTVLTATSTSFTYAEGGGAASTGSAALSLDVNTAATVTAWAELAAVAPWYGPYIYDPVAGLAVTAGNGVTTLAISADQQYDYVEVQATAVFKAPGYIALGFGFQNQTSAIKLLDVYTDPVSGFTRLVIDYSYRFASSFPVGSEVTLLAGNAPYDPLLQIPAKTNAPGSFWLTASPAGRVAAESITQAALAAGIVENIVVVYPGDIGLGGAGLPTEGAQKLSDIVYVFAGDEPEAEEQAAREEVPV